MSQTRYQVVLSTDGKHSVMVSSDNPEDIKTAGQWARAAYEALVTRYGDKDERHKASGNGNGESVPTCAVHQTPMVKVQGKHGAFWSCRNKNPDGSWCNYRLDGK